MRFTGTGVDRPADRLVGTVGAVAAGRRRVRDVLEEHLEHLARMEPLLKAWVCLDVEGARSHADSLDASHRAGMDLPALAGAVVGVKDLFDVVGLPTRAGSDATSARPARQDAGLVSLLCSSGATILGKTVTTEWAASDAAETRNPWDATRTPGGSSTGSAVAVASRMCGVATGTQTAGSLVRPAAYNGVAGFLPTPGYLPMDGLIPSAASLDVPGLLAPSVADARLVFSAIDASRPGPGPTGGSGSAGGGSPLRIGWIEELAARADEDQQRAMRQALATLSVEGFREERLSWPDDLDRLLSDHWTILAFETARHHRGRFAQDPDSYGSGIRSVIERGLEVPEASYRAAGQRRAALRGRLSAFFRDVDAVICPGAQGPAPKVRSATQADSAITLSTGDPAMQMPWTFAGCPVVAFPLAVRSDGMPLSAQVVARPGDDQRLLNIGVRIERIIGQS